MTVDCLLVVYMCIYVCVYVVVKSWPSEWCLEANKWGIQTLGGYGYTRDYAAEQIYRCD